MPLSDIIIQKIKDEGPISFRDFMDMSLYYPGLGYYTSDGNKIGRSGDYYTSPELTPAFGAMIAKQIEEMWVILGEKEFTVVEFGAGNGRLAYDILEHLKLNKDLYALLKYCIIEKSPAMREKEKLVLTEKVTWHDSIEELGEISGCILSNELPDNFPVHRVMMHDELMEIFVDHKDGFKEVFIPADAALKAYLTELQVELPRGFKTEINLEAILWMNKIAPVLKEGFVITIDYGYPSNELYSESRSNGTLMCFNKHHINNYPYQNIGEQDITAHVNFSALCHWGLKNGLDFCGLTNQANFLLSLGIKDYLVRMKNGGRSMMEIARENAFITYTLLLDMGVKFKVLIQRKGIEEHELSGLKTF
jgi:SAM-dependent MidA family methyltransferase